MNGRFPLECNLHLQALFSDGYLLLDCRCSEQADPKITQAIYSCESIAVNVSPKLYYVVSKDD